ncbi:hypothetical protein HF086_002172 [Spodoptera exigua]|uniref:Uncharacterized protein n=1 Tax=Spodoptera exigua TaxID=7107 RepID=A0A922MI30_SPOEX|nr:hypothetical protein HF086_002172 [Spodoptera exigua]
MSVLTAENSSKDFFDTFKRIVLTKLCYVQNPNVVARGATIASLLAAVFREGCRSTGVKLDEHGVLQNLDNPIMSEDVREELQNTDVFYGISHSLPFCLTAQDMAGSCMSKAFALLHMLSEDLHDKVQLADEAYNLYKNIKLAQEDEVCFCHLY